VQMEQQRKNSGESQEKLRTKLQKSQENAKMAMKELKEVGACKEEKETYQAESQQLIKERTKLELTKQDLTDEVTGDNNSKVSFVFSFVSDKIC